MSTTYNETAIIGVLCILYLINGYRGEGVHLDANVIVPMDPYGFVAKRMCLIMNHSNQNGTANCTRQFLSPTIEITETPPVTKFLSREKNQVFIEVHASTRHQLIILVPADGSQIKFLDFAIADPNATIVRCDPPPNSRHLTIWSTWVTKEGFKGIWYKGEVVPDRTTESRYHERLTPHFSNNDSKDRNMKNSTKNKSDIRNHKDDGYEGNQSKINVYGIKMEAVHPVEVSGVKMTFSWIKPEATSSEKELVITNACKSSSDNELKIIALNDFSNLTTKDLLVNDSCTFTINGTSGYQSLNYTVPDSNNDSEHSEGTLILEKPKILRVDPIPNDDTWDVYVTWSNPGLTPDFNNVTLEVNGNQYYSVIVAGNETEALVTNVTGEGGFMVRVLAVTSGAYAYTTEPSVFPSVVSRTIIMTSWWSILLLICIVSLGIFLYYKRKRRFDSVYYFEGLPYKLPKEPFPDVLIDLNISDDRWEIKPEMLRLQDVIGQGAFGVVKKGVLIPSGKEVVYFSRFPNSRRDSVVSQ